MSWSITTTFYIRSGVNQNEASIYTIIKLYTDHEKQFEQADEQPNTTPNAQADEQADEYIITKLNYLFNYLYKGESGAEIGLKEKDREGLINTLQHLELYVEDPIAYNLMTVERVLDEKIMQWAIKEVYLSPHKVYLNDLKRDKLVLKYLKTKKYITEKPNYRLEEIINYFIVCLHDEFENRKGFWNE